MDDWDRGFNKRMKANLVLALVFIVVVGIIAVIDLVFGFGFRF